MAVTKSAPRRVDALILVMILLIGAALRFSDLASLPSGLFYDESANGVDALRVLAGYSPGLLHRKPGS